MSTPPRDDTQGSFRGASVREALTALRAAWGDDALVLSVDRERDEFVVTATRGGHEVASEEPRHAGEERLRDRLREVGFSAGHARELTRGARDEEELSERIARELPIYPRRGCRSGDPSGRRFLVFAGPTGVGKTTTLAKLAGRLVRDAGIEPALVTLDTYRVAAVEQLRAYADLLGLPFRVANDTRELERALEATREHPVCLIDTAGRSPLDAERIAELSGLLGEDDRLERFLCLSATTAPSLLRDLIERFARLDPDACILTKLDENPCFGALLEAACAERLRIAYTTDGQEVPADLSVADAAELARRVLAGPHAFERRRMEVFA